ncbi:MAG TPA: cytochrome c3 family protein [Pyrinomonadaceae bacterium]|nr:cytochrome c3 family protein [Pyrinomonadaceae bacterium]
MHSNRSAQGTQPQKRTQSTRKPRVDYSHFLHRTHVIEKKLACDSCHQFPTRNWNQVRQGDTAFQDVAEFPQHASCLGCHREQFFARERPAPAICSNCHVAVTPRNTQRYLFPSLGDVTGKQREGLASEFVLGFPHDKHLDVVSLNRPGNRRRDSFVAVSWQQKGATESSEPKSCPVCHQNYQPQGNSDDEYVTKPPKDLGDNFWLKKATFKTIPNSHTVCFTCHNVDVGIPPAPSECGSCHRMQQSQTPLKNDFDAKLVEAMGVTDATIKATWIGRISSGTFRHEGGDHPNIGCLKCHNPAVMNTADKKSLSVPVKTCGGAEGCHITATSDDGGILNYEIDQKKAKAGFVCTKCHVSLGKEAMPSSHQAAIR